MERKYVILQEMNDSEVECWYYFIRHTGNEKNLKHLQKQLDSVEWTMLDDGSTFDLDLEHLVSESTAKEMTKVELNHYQWHRKFDGDLSRIDFKFKRNDDNEEKINKVCDIIGVGAIDNFIDDEDIDPEDLTDTEQYPSDEEESKVDLEKDEIDIANIINDTFLPLKK